MSDKTGEIAKFYRGRSIFITGASGFVGKVLLEKLLRACPDIGNIYILMRPKRVKTRVGLFLAAPLFDGLRQTNPTAFQKIIPIIGDITEIELRISPADAEILYENVLVVFHSAATVRFDEPLMKAAQMNIVGTRSIVRMCHKMKKLAAIVHVSTAYANFDQQKQEETLYPCPVEPQKLLDMLDWMDENAVDEVTPLLIGKRPNTYTFTKAIAEHLFAQMTEGLPAVIVRPATVTATWKDPFPGWIDSVNGPAGFMIAIGKGVMRSFEAINSGVILEFVPVDIVVTWNIGTISIKKLTISTSGSSTMNQIKHQLLIEMLESLRYTDPYEEVVWYPCGSTTPYKFLHLFRVYVYHYLHAYLMDVVARLSGKKARLLDIQIKTWKGVNIFKFFYDNQFLFYVTNTNELLSQLSGGDQELFNFDVTQLQRPEYILNYHEGNKKYIFHETGKRQ